MSEFDEDVSIKRLWDVSLGPSSLCTCERSGLTAVITKSSAHIYTPNFSYMASSTSQWITITNELKPDLYQSGAPVRRVRGIGLPHVSTPSSTGSSRFSDWLASDSIYTEGAMFKAVQWCSPALLPGDTTPPLALLLSTGTLLFVERTDCAPTPTPTINAALTSTYIPTNAQVSAPTEMRDPTYGLRPSPAYPDITVNAALHGVAVLLDSGEASIAGADAVADSAVNDAHITSASVRGSITGSGKGTSVGHSGDSDSMRYQSARESKNSKDGVFRAFHVLYIHRLGFSVVVTACAGGDIKLWNVVKRSGENLSLSTRQQQQQKRQQSSRHLTGDGSSSSFQEHILQQAMPPILPLALELLGTASTSSPGCSVGAAAADSTVGRLSCVMLVEESSARTEHAVNQRAAEVTRESGKAGRERASRVETTALPCSRHTQHPRSVHLLLFCGTEGGEVLTYSVSLNADVVSVPDARGRVNISRLHRLSRLRVLPNPATVETITLHSQAERIPHEQEVGGGIGDRGGDGGNTCSQLPPTPCAGVVISSGSFVVALPLEALLQGEQWPPQADSNPAAAVAGAAPRDAAGCTSLHALQATSGSGTSRTALPQECSHNRPSVASLSHRFSASVMGLSTKFIPFKGIPLALTPFGSSTFDVQSASIGDSIGDCIYRRSGYMGGFRGDADKALGAACFGLADILLELGKHVRSRRPCAEWIKPGPPCSGAEAQTTHAGAMPAAAAVPVSATATTFGNTGVSPAVAGEEGDGVDSAAPLTGRQGRQGESLQLCSQTGVAVVAELREIIRAQHGCHQYDDDDDYGEPADPPLVGNTSSSPKKCCCSSHPVITANADGQLQGSLLLYSTLATEMDDRAGRRIFSSGNPQVHRQPTPHPTLHPQPEPEPQLEIQQSQPHVAVQLKAPCLLPNVADGIVALSSSGSSVSGSGSVNDISTGMRSGLTGLFGLAADGYGVLCAQAVRVPAISHDRDNSRESQMNRSLRNERTNVVFCPAPTLPVSFTANRCHLASVLAAIVTMEPDPELPKDQYHSPRGRYASSVGDGIRSTFAPMYSLSGFVLAILTSLQHAETRSFYRMYHRHLSPETAPRLPVHSDFHPDVVSTRTLQHRKALSASVRRHWAKKNRAKAKMNQEQEQEQKGNKEVTKALKEGGSGGGYGAEFASSREARRNSRSKRRRGAGAGAGRGGGEGGGDSQNLFYSATDGYDGYGSDMSDGDVDNDVGDSNDSDSESNSDCDEAEEELSDACDDDSCDDESCDDESCDDEEEDDDASDPGSVDVAEFAPRTGGSLSLSSDVGRTFKSASHQHHRRQKRSSTQSSGSNTAMTGMKSSGSEKVGHGWSGRKTGTGGKRDRAAVKSERPGADAGDAGDAEGAGNPLEQFQQYSMYEVRGPEGAIVVPLATDVLLDAAVLLCMAIATANTATTTTTTASDASATTSATSVTAPLLYPFSTGSVRTPSEQHHHSTPQGESVHNNPFHSPDLDTPSQPPSPEILEYILAFPQSGAGFSNAVRLKTRLWRCLHAFIYSAHSCRAVDAVAAEDVAVGGATEGYTAARRISRHCAVDLGRFLLRLRYNLQLLAALHTLKRWSRMRESAKEFHVGGCDSTDADSTEARILMLLYQTKLLLSFLTDSAAPPPPQQPQPQRRPPTPSDGHLSQQKGDGCGMHREVIVGLRNALPKLISLIQHRLRSERHPSSSGGDGGSGGGGSDSSEMEGAECLREYTLQLDAAVAAHGGVVWLEEQCPICDTPIPFNSCRSGGSFSESTGGGGSGSRSSSSSYQMYHCTYCGVGIERCCFTLLLITTPSTPTGHIGRQGSGSLGGKFTGSGSSTVAPDTVYQCPGCRAVTTPGLRAIVAAESTTDSSCRVLTEPLLCPFCSILMNPLV